MAALGDDEKDAKSNDNEAFKYKPQKIAKFAEKDIKTLDAESKVLYNHKAKYTIGKDGADVVFMPSPHLYDKDGKYDPLKDKVKQEQMKRRKRETTTVDFQCKLAAGALDCDAIESTFNCKDTLLQTSKWNFDHPFINACDIAWNEHYSLKISPIDIWLLILQATAIHVDMNAEKLRKKWVKHEGKKTLIVSRDWLKGDPNNDWSGVVDEFGEQISKNTIDNVTDLLKADFSNSTKIDDIAAKVTIMDICKNYFSYKCYPMCGFPQIALTGTKKDWIMLYTKSKQLFKTKLDEKFSQDWGNALFPVLERFIVVFDGEIDCLFWNSMIKRGWHGRGSGSASHYSGWINVFFPLMGKKWNEYCVPYEGSIDYIQKGFKGFGDGPETDDYPNGLASAPVEWVTFDQKTLKLQFIGGFVGVKKESESSTNKIKNQDELSTTIGWVIGEKTKENEQTINDMKNIFKNKDLVGAK